MSELKVNTISEVTGANGVVIDSVKLKDSEVYTTKIQYTDGDDAITIADGGGITVAQNATFSGTIGSGAITSTGIVTGTAFTAGSAVLAEAELELLDGLTAGTAIASKVVTTDANIDTTGQRNLTISGELDAATLDISGAIDIAGASQFNSTITVGVDDTGYDVKLFGATSGSYFEWDESADQLNLVASGLGVKAAKDLGDGIHVKASDTSASVSNTGEQLVLERNSHCGLSILSSTSTTGNILFGDSGDNDIGKISYDHSDNLMSFTTNTAIGLKIDSIGAVTKPLQPAFFVTKNGSQNNIPINATTTVEWQIEAFDQNGDFASHTFTAPVTGRYAFSALINWSSWDTDFGYAWHRITTSNRTIFANIGSGNQVTADGYFFASSSILCDMDANDTCKIEIQFSNDGATQADIMQSSFFSGHLVC